MKTILHILKSSSKWWCYVYRRKFSKMFIVLRYDPLILSRISQVITSTSISGNQMIFIWMHDSVHFSSVTQSCPTLCVPMDCSTPGLPAHHQLPEFTQTHTIKSVMPSNHLILLLSPSPPALNLSQHQGLFKWVSSSHQVAKVLEFQLQHQSFQWTPRTDLL